MTFQLSCGHWLTMHGDYEVGAMCECHRCGTLRNLVIGFATGPFSFAWTVT